jgi:branched-chain amino acid transport system substrate-binding protein
MKAAGASGVVALAGCAGDGGGEGDSDNNGGGGGDETDSGGGGGSTDAPSTSYKIGVITARSGSYSFLGEGEYQGAVLAKEDVEEDLGVDIEIVEADTETDPNTGLERMKRLVNEERVDAVLGGVSSSVAIKMGNWASDNGVAYMAAGSHSDQTTGGKCAANMFRPTCSNSMLANALGGQMADYADSWYVMFADYTWGQTGAKAIKKAVRNGGGEITGEIGTPFPSQDYTQYLNEAANSGADGLAVVIAGTDQRIVTEQFNSKDIDMKMAGPLFEESVFWGIGKEATANAGLWATPWAASSPSSDHGEEFKGRVADEFDASPFSRHYMGYTSMDQLVRAADRAGSVAGADISAELEGHEVQNPLKQGHVHWRADDHQLIQPVDTVKALPVDEMQDDPYKSWFEHTSTSEGESVARSDSGCEL